jgi:hypothetical protein
MVTGLCGTTSRRRQMCAHGSITRTHTRTHGMGVVQKKRRANGMARIDPARLCATARASPSVPPVADAAGTKNTI